MSSKLDILLEFNTQLQQDLGLVDKDNDGQLWVNYNGEDIPVTIGGKRLVNPTKAWLREGEWEERIPFHPLSEQLNQGPSPVLNALKNYIVERIKGTFRMIAEELGELAVDIKRQKPLSAKASAYLAELVGWDATTQKTLVKVFNALSDVPEKRFVTILMRNGGGDNALRSTVVSFPFMDDANSEDRETFFGVKMPRKTKDKELIVSLLNYILGDEETRNHFYNAEVKSGDAPYLHSLLLTFKAFAEVINKLIGTHAKACQTLKPLEFKLEWAEQLADFDKFAETYGVAVPVLPGNSGVEVEEESERKPKSPYSAGADDVGLSDEKKPDVPFDGPYTKSSSRDRDDDRSSRSRDDDRNDRPARDTGGKSIAELLGRRRGRDDRDERRGSRDRDDRDDRDRDRRGLSSSRSSRRDW